MNTEGRMTDHDHWMEIENEWIFGQEMDQQQPTRRYAGVWEKTRASPMTEPDDMADELAEIRAAIMHNEKKGDYTARGLASHLAMSLRNLQRRLRASGTSASTLLNEARQYRAFELLSDRRISVEEVGYKLGFDSERGFRKAFERWTQKSPARVRREMAGQNRIVRKTGKHRHFFGAEAPPELSGNLCL